MLFLDDTFVFYTLLSMYFLNKLYGTRTYHPAGGV